MKLFSKKEPEEYQLEKWVWTTDDFEQMGWHDNLIYGIGFNHTDHVTKNEIMIDIDYIFKWVTDQKSNKFSFWISPATIVFKGVYDFKADFDYAGCNAFQISEISREDYRENGGLDSNGILWRPDWFWGLWGEAEIQFRSYGFTQYIRQKPRLYDAIYLGLEERGGICFTRGRTDIEEETTP